jgi:hypothetical protein
MVRAAGTHVGGPSDAAHIGLPGKPAASHFTNAISRRLAF